MYPYFPDINPKKLAERICINEHLTLLFLDYMRYQEYQNKFNSTLRNNEIKHCLQSLKQEALATFFAEASHSFPVEKLNGKTDEFLEELTNLMRKKI